MQIQKLVGSLGILCKRVDEITPFDTNIDNEALALALQSQMSFNNAEWDEVKLDEKVTNFISEKHFFKPVLPEKPEETGRG